MYFKCDYSKITAEQLATCVAVSSLFQEQSMSAVVSSIKPITFEIKNSLPKVMQERLLRDRIKHVAQGYTGVLGEHSIVIQKEKTAKPA